MCERVVLHGDCLDRLGTLPDASVHAIVTDPPAGISFMGKSWDSDRGGADSWIAWMSERARECLRVIRPGGHALVWALPRTSHWTARAWELAGWEIRDRLSHIFGTGFPKSLDIGKAIDREMGAERPVIGTRIEHDIRGGHMHACNGTATMVHQVTAPGSPEAERWDGWHTALKPAVEDWWLLRAPLRETSVARNVLAHGAGGINIGTCRVGGSNGRWAPHLLLSHAPDCGKTCAAECPVQLLDEQSGASKSRSGSPRSGRHGTGWGMTATGAEYDDAGGASRYYPTFRYIPKPSRTDRDFGLEGEPTGLKHRVNPGGLESDPRWAPAQAKNTHPTVKSIELMSWLVRLVTPPGGAVLDPFCGSGTTGVAAALLGLGFIGIEQDAEWARLASIRIAGTDRQAESQAETRPTQLDLLEDLF